MQIVCIYTKVEYLYFFKFIDAGYINLKKKMYNKERVIIVSRLKQSLNI